jgi:hypothetical protein
VFVVVICFKISIFSVGFITFGIIFGFITFGIIQMAAANKYISVI